jgi:hypothetical protein
MHSFTARLHWQWWWGCCLHRWNIEMAVWSNACVHAFMRSCTLWPLVCTDHDNGDAACTGGILKWLYGWMHAFMRSCVHIFFDRSSALTMMVGMLPAQVEYWNGCMDECVQDSFICLSAPVFRQKKQLMCACTQTCLSVKQQCIQCQNCCMVECMHSCVHAFFDRSSGNDFGCRDAVATF